MCPKAFFFTFMFNLLGFFSLFRDINFDKFGESADYFNNNNIPYAFGEYKLANTDSKTLYNTSILHKKIYLMGF